MKFDKITVAPCLNPPPKAAACPDTPVQPDDSPLLILKPAVLCLATDSSAVLRAFAFADGVEIEIHGGLTFTSSDPTIALVGGASGVVTGIKAGTATITVEWSGMTAQSTVSVDATGVSVGMALVIDDSLSMGQAFGPPYSMRLAFAKDAASQFAGDVNITKDFIGLLRFDESGNVIDGLTTDLPLVQSGIAGTAVTLLSTNIVDALSAAIDLVNAASIDKRVVVLITDGENKLGGDPLPIATAFKDSGGVIVVLGVRASDEAFDLLTQLASAGLFVNATPENSDDAIASFRSLKGYFCAGNCTPPGDVYVGRAELNYENFSKWNVLAGHVDLIGGTPPYDLYDLLPGNGLYVDLSGSSAPFAGLMGTKDPIPIQAGKTYEVSFYLAGNQRQDAPQEIVRVILGTVLNENITITDWKQDFTRYSFTVTPVADEDATLYLSQVFVSAAPFYGTLLDNVSVRNTTDGVDLFSDNFDEENSSYVAPACGPAVEMGAGQELINIDVVASGTTGKDGSAAIGIPGDIWNSYKPRLVDGPFIPPLALSYADGVVSNASISQFPDPGEKWWQAIGLSGSTDDLMVESAITKDSPGEVSPWQECGDFATFSDPLSGCRWLAITGLATGSYDFYVYGHGGSPSFNSRFRLTVEYAQEQEKQTNEGNGYLGAYTENEQYVLFKNVQVVEGQNIYLFLLPPEDNSVDVNFNSWNGMQIVRKLAVVDDGVPFGYGCEGYGCLREPLPEQEEDLLVVPDPEAPGRPVYLAYQCYTAVCPTALEGDDVIECVQASSHISQARADKKALQHARRLAEAAIICVGASEGGPTAETIPVSGLNYLFSTLGFALINNDSGNWHIFHIEGALNEENAWWEDAVPLVPVGSVIGAGLNYEFSTSARFRIKNTDTAKYHGIWTVGAAGGEQLEIGASGSTDPDVTLLAGPRFRFLLNQFWVKNVDTGLWQPPSFDGADDAASLNYGAQAA